ncbi:MAG: hypothetical protein AAF411_03330 [Myxococcota bacterium]
MNERQAQAFERVDRVRSERTLRPPSWRGAAVRVARTYEQGGRAAVRSLLQRQPSLIERLAAAPREQALETMRDAAGYFDGGNALDTAAESIEGRLRQHVMNRANQVLNRAVRDLGRAEALLRTNPEALLSAPEGSAMARVRDSFQLSAPVDAAAAAERLRNSTAELRDLQSRFQGQTWEVGDFPVSARMAMESIGQRSLDRATIGGEIAARESGEDMHMVHWALDGVHALVSAGEIVHAGRGAVFAAETLGVFLAGFAVAGEIHHAVVERREGFEALGREAGL